MIDRVAKAIAASFGEPDEFWENWKPQARAAIEAMREPTEAMVRAGNAALRHVPREDFMAAELSSDPQALAKMKQPIRWRAMIDEALK